jgi:hypothetical protein
MKAPKPEEYLPKPHSAEDDLVPVNFRVPSGLKSEFEEALKKMGFNQTDFFRGQMKWLIDHARSKKPR